MAVRVQLTDGAAGAPEEICNYIERQDLPARANDVLDRIEEAFQGLSERPQRGRYPRELLDMGIRDCREVFFKPYGIVYRVIEEAVYVLAIANGRRDMQSLLLRRLLQT